MRASIWNRLCTAGLLAVSLVTISAPHSASAATATISGRITAGGTPVAAGSVQVVFIPYTAGCGPTSVPLQVTPVGADGRYSYSLDTQYDYKVMFKPLTTAPRSALFRWYFSANSGGTTDGYDVTTAAAATCLDLTSTGLADINLDTSGTSVQFTGSLASSSGSIVPPSSVFITRTTTNYLQDPNGYAARTSDTGAWEIAGVDASQSNMYIQVMVPAGNPTAPRFFVKKDGQNYSLISSADVGTCGEACKFNTGVADVSNMSLKLPVLGQISGTISGPNGSVGAGQVCATAFSDGGSSMNMYSLQVGSVCTDANGQYVLGLAYGSYRLQFVSQPGSPFKTEWFDNVGMVAGYTGATVVTVSNASPSATAGAVLELGKSISGRVTDYLGQPIAAMRVSAMMRNSEFGNFMQSGSAPTNENGDFSITGLDPGTYTLMAQNTDYGMQWLGGTRETATTFVVSSGDSGVAGKNISFPRGYKVAGTLTTADSSEANICVSAWAVSDTTMGWGELAGSGCFMAPGGWQIKGLKAGPYRFRFDAQSGNLRSTFLGGNDINTATVLSIAGADVSNINVNIPAGKSVTGKIVNSNPSPVPSVCVGAFKVVAENWGWGTWAGSACTGTNGEFLIRGLEEGTYRLRIDTPQNSDYSPGFYSSGTEESVVRNIDNATPIVIGSTSLVTAISTITLKTGPKFTATVTDGGNGVSGVCVNALKKVSEYGWGEWSTSACSGFDGKIVLRGLAAGSYTFQVNPQSGNYQSGWFRSGTTTTTNQSLASLMTMSSADVPLGNIALVSGKNVMGTLKNAGNPIVGACVQALKDDGGYWGMWSGSGCSNANGEFKIRGLDPTASYRFRVDVWAGDFKPGFIADDKTIQSAPTGITALPATEDISLGTITMTTAPSIKGTIFSGSTTKESNVCVNAHDAVTLQWMSSSCTSSSGTYALRGLTAGDSYKISWWTQKPLLTSGWYKQGNSPTQVQNPSDATILTIDANGRSGLDIFLANGGSISGTLTSGSCVAAWLQSDNDKATRTDASAVSCANDSNEFELRGLLPTTDYFLEVFKKDGSTVNQTDPSVNTAVRTGGSNVAITAS